MTQAKERQKKRKKKKVAVLCVSISNLRTGNHCMPQCWITDADFIKKNPFFRMISKDFIRTRFPIFLPLRVPKKKKKIFFFFWSRQERFHSHILLFHIIIINTKKINLGIRKRSRRDKFSSFAKFILPNFHRESVNFLYFYLQKGRVTKLHFLFLQSKTFLLSEKVLFAVLLFAFIFKKRKKDSSRFLSAFSVAKECTPLNFIY